MKKATLPARLKHIVGANDNNVLSATLRDNKADLFFQNGKLSEKLVKNTLKICEKYLDDILGLMEDEAVENAIDVSEKYQIIFVPVNEINFMYAIATKSVDPVLLNPVFERIAKRIKDAVLKYKKDLE